MKLKPIVVAIVASLASNISYAQEKPLSSVKVVGTAFEDQVNGITSDKLENMQATDVKDVLKNMPSVVVDGAARYSQKVYVRGLEDKFANITIDGARMTGELFHHSGDQTIDAEMLKIGEVELGPNSALSGAGVINGSFVYETKDPTDMLKMGETFGGKVGAGYQTGFERKSGNVALFGTASQYLEYLFSGNLVDDGTLTTPGNVKENSKESRLTSALAKVILRPTDDSSFALSYNLYSDGGDRQLAGEKPGTEINDNTENTISRNTITGKFAYNPNDMVDLSLKLYNNKQTLQRMPLVETNRKNKNIKIQQPERNYENASTGFDLRNATTIGNSLITFGIDGAQEQQEMSAEGQAVYVAGPQKGKSENVAVGGIGKVKQWGIYFEEQLTLENWLFNLGARYDNYELAGMFDGKFTQFSPKAKIAWQATNHLRFRTGYGRIFKGPALGETLMLGSYKGKQSDKTAAQTGNNIEVGLDINLADAFPVHRSLLGFTVYHYNVDNYEHPTKNIGLEPQMDVEFWGFESVLTAHTDKSDVSVSYTYSDGEQTNLKAPYKKSEPKTANIHTLKFDYDRKINSEWAVNYNGQLVGGNTYKTEKEMVMRTGYGVHNIGASYQPQFLKGAKVNFGIDNIFNKKYTRHTAFGTYFGNEKYASYEVGRNYKINLMYKF